ncbi:hypothetical protein MTAT_17450 [Moorella thermoacetica]|uniref:Uncharacterized protein n=1 Tax=Neomoorella thermoacetica TaxID=1525 RepID=A0AAC9HG66_NEOTH|nr:hypothetical protein [Moorella thermoacetica]AOQ23215.1 hypothetical protein Maut_00753 [Moorella thermoacetica]TYL12921.1 hypothetical protein MTAT_17450 [Moorella thermoacetica]
MQLKEIPITGIPYDQLYIEKIPATPEYCRRPAELLPAGNRSVVVNPNRTCMPLGAMWGAHLSRLKEKVDLELEFHGHNDFGLARPTPWRPSGPAFAGLTPPSAAWVKGPVIPPWRNSTGS